MNEQIKSMLDIPYLYVLPSAFPFISMYLESHFYIYFTNTMLRENNRESIGNILNKKLKCLNRAVFISHC